MITGFNMVKKSATADTKIKLDTSLYPRANEEVYTAMLSLLKGFAAANIQGDGLRVTGKLYYRKLDLETCVTYFPDMGVLEIRIGRSIPTNKKYCISKETRDYFRITEVQAHHKVFFEKEFWIKELPLKSMLKFIASWFKTMMQNITDIRMVNRGEVL